MFQNIKKCERENLQALFLYHPLTATDIYNIYNEQKG